MKDDDQPTHDTGLNTESIDATDAQLPETGSSAPDRPRKKARRNYDGRQPLDDRCEEAVAQFLATPKQLRQPKVTLAKCLNVSRMTIHRWAHDPDVLLRAEYLVKQNMVVGQFVARREWPRIVEAHTVAAIKGSIRSASFCQNIASPHGLSSEIMWFKDDTGTEDHVGALIAGDEILQAEELSAGEDNHRIPEDKNSQK